MELAADKPEEQTSLGPWLWSWDAHWALIFGPSLEVLHSTEFWQILLPWLLALLFLALLAIAMLEELRAIAPTVQLRTVRRSIRHLRLPDNAVRLAPPPEAAHAGGAGQLRAKPLKLWRWLHTSRRIPWSNLEFHSEAIKGSRGHLVAFVNSRSGGRQGIEVLQELRTLLHRVQVVDLQQEGPEHALRWWSKNSRRYRVLVCGGDGTVGWVLSCLEQRDAEDYIPPVAILPLGTGNDLARVTGWGGGFGGGSVAPILRKVREANVALIDKWAVACRDALPVGRPATLRALPVKQRKALTMCNYLGIGVDAAVALDFHQMRERRPHLFVSRLINKLWYLRCGLKNQPFPLLPWSNFASQVTLECDGVEVAIPSSLQGIVLLNITSFGGGSDLWGSTQDTNDTEESDDEDEDEDDESSEDDSDGDQLPGCLTSLRALMNDQKVEVVGVHGSFQLGAAHVGLYTATRLAQASHVKICTKGALPIQVDGEPWQFDANGEIEVSWKGQAFMLTQQGGGRHAVATDIVEWAVEEKVISVNQRNRMMREIACRAQSVGSVADLAARNLDDAATSKKRGQESGGMLLTPRGTLSGLFRRSTM